MASETFARVLLERTDDEHPGLRFEDETRTWAQMVAASRARARMLAGACPAPAGRPRHVGVLLENVPEYVYWIGAAALAGATVVGINPTRRGAELAADVRHTDCDLIITDAAHVPLLAEFPEPFPAGRVHVVDSPAYRDRLHAVPEPEAGVGAGPGREPRADDRLLLLFTSGSTGTPKAVACSQGRLASIAGRSAQMGITRDSVTYAAMPLFHGNAVMANLAMAAHAGATVALRRRFSASGFLPDVRRYGVTYFNYVGRALAYILATPEDPGDAANTLRAAFGTEASAQDMTRFAARFGCRIIEGYGSSEGAIAMQKTPETPPDALGVPQRDIRIAVLDPETGAECARARFDGSGGLANPGEAIGEIVGLNVAAAFEGYYNDPAADAERVRDGKYWSGDLGYRDEDGFFYFAGRGADRLRVDSENFAAAPVERILARWAPVVMCAVYPVPDPRTGDQVMAALELHGDPGGTGGFDPGAFAAFLAAQPDLGTKWAPRFVRLVRAMPLTATGKVDKRPLRRTRWEAGDPVWWRPGRDLAYEPLTHARAGELRAEFAAHGRAHVLTAL
ncbi:AMP-binding protein [Actinomadura xylanilytica]|uniref:AMP-binding protein n=1 Tax=Actinomadura xylanilytica TaxID=887459 RepID=UPI00255A7524|nr:AMP-binding protein [Actinomadura xylanilytica]MDL4771288.1 AMP-binding protein [Actinomadura xylanilytica]